MNYIQAIEAHYPNGAVNMTPAQMQAHAAQSIAAKHGMRPAAVYDWANTHDIKLTQAGAKLSTVKARMALLNDVIGGTYKHTKTLLATK